MQKPTKISTQRKQFNIFIILANNQILPLKYFQLDRMFKVNTINVKLTIPYISFGKPQLNN